MQISEFLNQFNSMKIPIVGVRLPTFSIDEKYKKELNVEKNIDNFEFLRALCIRGFKSNNYNKQQQKEYGDRVKYELDIIKELGFVDYILLVWDVINFCKENNIPTGLGRGSAAGSLVLYLIEVTKIDPIKNGLYFERFISKTRAKKQIIDGNIYLDGSLMCDIDIDICYYNRSKVLAYLEEKFKGKTSKILTFNTLSAKLLIKEIGKILGGKPEEEMTHVTSLIPKNHGVVKDIEEAYEEVEEFKNWCDQNKSIYETALKLKDLIKNKGVHPSGIMITHDLLEDCCPTELSSDKDIVSSYDMEWVSLFSVKLDALGLRGVSVVDDVCKLLKININDIDLEDVKIYQNLQDLRRPHGLFQIEADMAFQFTRKVKPRNLNQLSAVLALARPGAMQFINQFSLFTNSGTVDNIHPFFEDILAETGGVCLYQEQMMKMAHKIGFTLDEAEILRRIVGKKKIEEVKIWQQKIKDKVTENKLDPEISGILWKILEDSASYSFNKSHSVAYASLSALTIYLKFNYPTEFYLSLLRMAKHEPNPIEEFSKIHREMVYFNIKLLPPSLATSNMDFMIENKDIRFGLSSIKGISEKTIIKINNFKRSHSNKFELFESAKEAGLFIGITSALIQAGALDKFVTQNQNGINRCLLVYEAQLWNNLTLSEKQMAMQLAKNTNDFRLANIVQKLNTEIKNEKSKPIIKDSRMSTIKKNTEKYKLIYKQNTSENSQAFANWYYEKMLLGYSTYTTLIDIFRSKKSSLVPISEIRELSDNGKCDFVGYVEEDPKASISKNGNKYAKYMISDEFGTAKVMIFGTDNPEKQNRLEFCKEMNDGLPKEGSIVIVSGTKKEGDTIFADTISRQENKIYTKLSQLKDKAAKESVPELLQTGQNQG